MFLLAFCLFFSVLCVTPLLTLRPSTTDSGFCRQGGQRASGWGLQVGVFFFFRKSAVLHSSHFHWKETDWLSHCSNRGQETEFLTSPLCSVSLSHILWIKSDRDNETFPTNLLPANSSSIITNDGTVFLFCKESEEVMNECKTYCQTYNLQGRCGFACLFIVCYSVIFCFGLHAVKYGQGRDSKIGKAA